MRSLALILPLLVVAMFALAVYLARGRRRQTLIEVGAAFVGAGLAVVVVRGIAGSKVVDSLATTEAVRTGRTGGMVDRDERACRCRVVDRVHRRGRGPRGDAGRPDEDRHVAAPLDGALHARPSGRHLRRARPAVAAAVRVGADRGDEIAQQGSSSLSCWRYLAQRRCAAKRHWSFPTRILRRTSGADLPRPSGVPVQHVPPTGTLQSLPPPLANRPRRARELPPPLPHPPRPSATLTRTRRSGT